MDDASIGKAVLKLNNGSGGQRAASHISSIPLLEDGGAAFVELNCFCLHKKVMKI